MIGPILGKPETWRHIGGFVILLEDRDPQPVLRIEARTPSVISSQAELDGLGLEVVAEREVPEHLEEGVVAMASGPTILQIVVLSGNAQALLGHWPLGTVVPLVPSPVKVVLELHSSRRWRRATCPIVHGKTSGELGTTRR